MRLKTDMPLKRIKTGLSIIILFCMINTTCDTAFASPAEIEERREDALDAVEFYLATDDWTYDDLMDQLETDGISHSDAIWAMKNCSVDWEELEDDSTKNIKNASTDKDLSSKETGSAESVTTSEPITTSEPERLLLTNAMVEDIKDTYGDDIKMHLFFVMLLRKLGGEATISSVEILDEEKYNSYSYIYYYRVNYDQNYSHYQTDIKMVIEAFEDTSEEKGYRLDPVHLYEGGTQLW